MNTTSCEAALELRPPSGESPASAALMFAAGVLGNVTALGLLLRARARRRARRERLAPFHVLVMALVLTDLLGTCLLSPVVLAAYGRRRTLRGLSDGGGVCLYFAFAMSFFSLATMGCLGAMALERSLAIGAPYLYERLLSARPVAPLLLAALPALYALAAAFCALPLLGFGRYVQYCPGTWCFIQMHFPRAGGAAELSSGGAFSLLYASLLLLLILAVLLCNLSVIVNLLRMQRRGKATRRATAAAAAAASSSSSSQLRQTESSDGQAPSPRCAARKQLSMFEELDHLILLAIITITFAVCSLPFTVRAFMNHFDPGVDYKEDLQAMRFLSFNSIIDPWVFAILRPPILRVIRSVLCCRVPLKPRTTDRQRPPFAKPKPVEQAGICRQ
ncbi:prostaglandin E2 receptor EP2 subtype [Podarcis lilfordi]|uniref:Prostaglandin E2 receptor EP2 subtype n=2 Tax=Podarcis lilfordi TaxID=74358 RepID=A0AA35JRN3_9SAUR|nr:prostaglandin E2 receptor EP2 subtype [Podarcis lilfordi]